jgi:hypothetical protein
MTWRPRKLVTTVHDLAAAQSCDDLGRAISGERSYQQHLNFAAIGQTAAEFPGGFTSHHNRQGTPEFAYGLTKWWEIGFYLPFAVTGNGEFLSDGAKIRNLFVVPDAAKRDFFYGVIMRCRNSR